MLRRDALKLAVAAPLLLAAADAGAPLFFTKDEFALLDRLSEIIIPTDDHSPGAHDAGVAKYIDLITAEAIDPKTKTSWRNGLRSVDELARRTQGHPFIELRSAAQVSLVTQLMKDNPAFFGELKESTAYAYYTSDIGIHKEMGYRGNVLLDKFEGFDAT